MIKNLRIENRLLTIILSREMLKNNSFVTKNILNFKVFYFFINYGTFM